MIDVQSDRKPAHPRRRQQMPRPPARAFIRSRPASVARGRSSEHMSRTHGRNQCDSISTCPVSSSQAQDAPTLFSGRGESKELLITQMRHRKPKSSVRACVLGTWECERSPISALRSLPAPIRSRVVSFLSWLLHLFFLSGTWLTTPGTGNPKPAATVSCHDIRQVGAGDGGADELVPLGRASRPGAPENYGAAGSIGRGVMAPPAAEPCRPSLLPCPG